VRQLALIFRDHREDLQRRWLSLLPGRIGDDYREVLESPVGVKLVRGFIEELLAVAQAEEYEAPALMRRVTQDSRAAAARRAELGFELGDVLAGVQLLRSALWYVLEDVLVMGKLPAVGETIDEMRQVDEYVDRLIRAEIEGFLGGDPGDGAAAG
jgi:hypothetical protein